MTIEQKLIAFQEILDEDGILTAKGIHEENHRPHPYTVGPEHTAEANKNGGDGVITEEICEKLRCAHPKCTLKYSEHKADAQLLLQLKRDALESQVHDQLLKIKVKLKELEIKSVAFVDTEEGYKFLKDEQG